MTVAGGKGEMGGQARPEGAVSVAVWGLQQLGLRDEGPCRGGRDSDPVPLRLTSFKKWNMLERS